MAKKIQLIVGLGNPGQKYFKTRHNAGFMVIDQIVVKHNLGNPQKNKNYELWMWDISPECKVLLVKPLTFMNSSGEAVGELMRFFKVSDEDILVISDDLDLLVGQVRLRYGGSSGGHKGLQSIIDILGFDHFGRIKIGIGRPPEHVPAEDYVLSQFSEKNVQTIIDQVAEIVVSLATGSEKFVEETINIT